MQTGDGDAMSNPRTASAAHARRGLEAYASRHSVTDEVDVDELRPLIDEATRAGLSIAEIGCYAEGRQIQSAPVI
jgi:hypothetical protein